MTGRWFLPPALSQEKKHRHFWCSTGLSSPDLTQPLDLFPLAISGAIPFEFPLGRVPVANNFRRNFLGLAFLFPGTGTACIWGWFLKECKEFPPVKIWGTFTAALEMPGGVEDSSCVRAGSTTEMWLICVLLELEEFLGRRITLQHFPNTVLGKGNGITTRKAILSRPVVMQWSL